MAFAIRYDEETCVAPGVDLMKTVLFWFSRDPIKNLKRDMYAFQVILAYIFSTLLTTGTFVLPKNVRKSRFFDLKQLCGLY